MTNSRVNWHRDAFFYHIYPLGFCAAPMQNTPDAAGSRLTAIHDAIPHMQQLGINALYLGPVFAATSHGYDTNDYFQIDPRLGTKLEFQHLVTELHQTGIRVVLDGVFNHVGRNFWAFTRLQDEQSDCEYKNWFRDVDFSQNSPLGDPFSYLGWEGHFELVTLNLEHPPVRDHILQAVDWMIDELGIDGLRLDVAYCLPKEFLAQLRGHIQSKSDSDTDTGRRRRDFYLLGEVIHGEYGEYLGEHMLDAVTNYECYKGLWSSHNDGNYFEIAHSLDRQFSQATTQGNARRLSLYNFADNHDVDRTASQLQNIHHLFPLYGMLMTMPGTPSLYYGSEFGISGSKTDGNDQALRPAWKDVHEAHPALHAFIKELSEARNTCEALRIGGYTPLLVNNHQLAFLRSHNGEHAVAAMNSADHPVTILLSELPNKQLTNMLNRNNTYHPIDGCLELELPAYGTAILATQNS